MTGVESGESPSDHVRRLNGEIQSLRAAHEYTTAISIADHVCRFISDAGGAESVVYAQARGSLGQLLHEAGRIEEAIGSLEEAVVLQWTCEHAVSPGYLGLLNALVAAHRDRGSLDKIRDQIEEVVRSLRDACSKGLAVDNVLSGQLGNLGSAEEACGDYPAAASAFDEAISTAGRLGQDTPAYARAANNRAGLHDLVGDYAEAERLYRDARSVFLEAGAEWALALASVTNNLGALRYRQGHHDEARTYLQEAGRLLREVESRPALLKLTATLSNLALVHRDTGRLEEAEATALEALATVESLASPPSLAVAEAEAVLGFVHLSQGQTALASSELHRSYETQVAMLGKRNPQIASALRNLALVALIQNDTKVALEYLKEAADITDRTLDDVFSCSSERQRLAQVEALRFSLDAFLSILTLAPHDDELLGAAFRHVLRHRGLAAEALARQRDRVIAMRSASLTDQVRELTHLRWRIATATMAGSTEAAQLASWAQRREELESTLASQVPEIQVAQALRGVDAQVLVDCLPEGSALIAYVKFRQVSLSPEALRVASSGASHRYLAFVLSASDPTPKLVDLGDAAPIEDLVAGYRSDLLGELAKAHPPEPDATTTRPQPEIDPLRNLLRSQLRDFGDADDELPPAPFDPTRGRTLRAAVFDCVAERLPDATRLIIAPDGDLTRIPFEALPLNGSGFVIDRYRLSYVAFPRDVLRVATTSVGCHSSPVVMANPDFDLGSGAAPPLSPEHQGDRFRPLTNTEEEGRQVALRLRTDCLSGPRAVKPTLLQLRGPAVLHLATHGYFVALDPELSAGTPMEHARSGGADPLAKLGKLANPLLRSGIALAGANRWLNGELAPDADNGLLSAEELTGIDLFGTELVVLSACETGLGALHADEGVLGLRSAVLLAGARTLVISLWEVSDPVTAELMRIFYDGLLSGKARNDALREAQLDVRTRHPHPNLWGAFICHGAWERLPDENPPT